MSEANTGDSALSGLMREAFGGTDPSENGEIPKQFGRFSVVRKLGQGGMGDVFVAFDETLQRKVALKTIRSTRRLDVEAQSRFLREARILSQLDHPGICRIHDFVRGDEVDVLVLELIEGEDLAERMARSVSRGEAMRFITQLVDALSAAHSAGVVHRDLKPANVMISSDGELKVLDFGIARAVGAEELEGALADGAGAEETGTHVMGMTGLYKTMEGSVLGTLLYMSPEQARGELVTAASDMYSAGLIAQELLTGAPVQPNGLSFDELYRRVREGVHEPMTRRNASGKAIARDFVSFVAELKSGDPGQRPAAHEAHERLLAIAAKPRKRMVQVAAAAAVLVSIGAGVKYTVDLEAERSRAVSARIDADLRRSQAEELIDNVVGDLRERLQPLGRLDLLEGVGDLAQSYFASIPEEKLTPRELRRRSQTLYQLGEVQAASGDLAASHALAAQSVELARRHVDVNPDDTDWLFELGQSEFYVGAALRDQGDAAGARRHWQHYLDVSKRLIEIAPDHVEWQTEHAWARTNLAVLDLESGATKEAESEFMELRDFWAERSAAQPDDKDTRVELADIQSWYAEALIAQGRGTEAVDVLFAELEGREWMVSIEPEIAEWKRRLSTTHNKVAQALLTSGSIVGGASKHVLLALEQSDALVVQDPRNAEWLREHGLNLSLSATISQSAEDPSAAAQSLAAGREIFERLLALDPSNVEWLVQSSRIHVTESNLSREAGELDAAETSARRAAALLEERWASSAQARFAMAEAWQAIGRCLDERGDREGARASWHRVFEVYETEDAVAPRQYRDHELFAECALRDGDHQRASMSLDALRALAPLAPRMSELERAFLAPK